MTTYVLVNAYQEADNLPRMWESVQTSIPGEVVLVVVDGKYPDYDDQHDLSVDGTRTLAQAYGHLIDCCDDECEKRTFGLRYIDTLAKDGDWVLYLDADETITQMGPWPNRVGYFSFTRNSRPDIVYGRCRLYRWEPGLEFKGRHYDLYDAQGELVSSLEDAPDFDIVGAGVHYNDSHSPERVAKKRDYYKLLRERESSPWLQPTH